MADSVVVNAMEAIQTRLRAQTFTGLLDANIVIVEDPRLAEREGTDLPAILISTGQGEQFGLGDNANDDVGYRLIVAIVDHHNSRLVANTTELDDRLLWRETLRKALHQWTMPTVTEVYFVTLQPLQPIDRRFLPSNLFVSGMGVTVHSEEARTAP